MADYLAGFYPDFVEKEEPREIILKLGKMITNRIPVKLGLQKLNKYDPEYWGLAMLLTDEQAELALKMGVRQPKTMADLVKLSGKDEAYLEKLLEEMSFIGILEYNWENPTRTKQWILPLFVPGSAEFTNMNDTILKKYPEMGRFFERMSRLPLEKVTPMVPPGGAGIGMHVIPVEKAIGTENQSIPIEHISYWLDKYEGKYAATPCSCRKSRMTFDEGCADDPEGWCIAVGDMADYGVETGKGGRYISKEEALEIFRQAEENGFVHQITNIDGVDKIFAICNCNLNVCYALRTSQLFNTPNLSRSAYVAKVSKEDCVACGKCVEVCPAGAVKLGQKLCTKDGSEIEYPRHILPGEVKWGPHMWDENYRDNNRINCYDTGTAPCKTACPAHIAVQGYLKMAAQGRYTEALALIKKDNPLPAICGRICNRRCEDACTRASVDQAVAIDEVKKFIAQKDLDAETRYIPKKVVPSLNGFFPEKIAIIGAGPAGLSCAFYLAEKGYSPTVFEKNEKPGGMLQYGIPGFKLEKDVIDAEIDIIKAMGVEIRCGVEVGRDISLDELRAQGYKAFYLGIGASAGAAVSCPGDDKQGVFTGIDFLKAVNMGEKPEIGSRVAVIGAGNVAIDVARTAVRLGAEEVSIIYRRSRDEMPASHEEVVEAEEDGVKFRFLSNPVEIMGDGKVEALRVEIMELGEPDEKGRRKPEGTGRYEEIPVSAVISAIGQKIELGGISGLQTGRNDVVIVDPLTCQTSVADIFAGGDVVTGPKFAIDAIAAGKEGAISIHRYVQPHSSLTIGRNRRQFIELDKNNISIEQYDNSSRQIPGKRSDVDKRSMRDASLPFTEEQVKAETARCLGCGASVVDPNKCIGCGVCTTKCEFDAIKLYRDRPECSTMIPTEKKLPSVLGNGAKQAIMRKLRGK